MLYALFARIVVEALNGLALPDVRSPSKTWGKAQGDGGGTCTHSAISLQFCEASCVYVWSVPLVQISLGRTRIVIAVNENGRRIGETHHNARIPDVIVNRIRDRHEDDGIGYKQLAVEFCLALTTVRKICTYERRAQTPDRWKTLVIRG